MKLIAENALDDQLIPGLVSLLRDFKVDANGFRTDEAIATVFWSPEDIAMEHSYMQKFSKDDILGILAHLEPDLLESMILAGFEVIEKYLKDTTGTAVYQQHRNLQ